MTSKSLSQGGSLSGGVSVWGISVQGVSVQRGLCPGGSLSRGSLSRGISVWGVSVRETPLIRWRTGGTHPTGMHSCFWNEIRSAHKNMDSVCSTMISLFSKWSSLMYPEGISGKLGLFKELRKFRSGYCNNCLWENTIWRRSIHK